MSVLLAVAVHSAAVLLLATTGLSTSGPVGIYGIVEKVVFEPNEQSPERIQVWGAFAYVEGGRNQPLQVSAAKRGYLYFRLASAYTTPAEMEAAKREWADLKAVAGTGQAVGFGTWGYIGGFGALQPDAHPSAPSVILERIPQGGARTDLRVRPAGETPTYPATYQTNAGVVKLPDTGSHADIVKQLRDALRR